ncbi:MAG: sugar phosphate nucleotidyltransferase [Ignavibacteriales bacterium]|nr:sugar phosphate nucleotidyltransferase [Ignavibacteriales bacterium]
MDLVILGSDQNTYIKAEGLAIPKPLAIINGEYLIERIIKIAYECGVNKVCCIMNSNETELKNFLLSNKFGASISLLIQDTQSSMQSLFSLAHFLSKEPLCLITANAVFSKVEFSSFIDYSKTHQDANGVIAVTRFIDDKTPIYVAMDEEDTILKFSDSKDGYGWVSGRIYYFSTGIFEEIDFALKNKVSGLRDFLRHLVSRGYILKGFSFNKIIDIEYIADIAKAESFIKGTE